MTATAIVNIALRRIGVTRIESLENDQSTEAIAARDIYDEARRDLLGLHTWKFAKRRAQLTASTTAPAFGRLYAYPLPADFIRLVNVSSNEDDEGVCPYKLENQEGDDRVILADSATIYITYIFDLQDANVFSSVFRDLLAFRITPDLAAALNRSINEEDFNERRFLKKLARAKTIDGTEDMPSQMADGSWVSERGDDPTQDF